MHKDLARAELLEACLPSGAGVPAEADPLGKAARRTEAAGTARVSSVEFTAEDEDTASRLGIVERFRSSVWQCAEGVVDFAERRVHLILKPVPNGPVEALATKMEEKWPWLGEADDPNDESECEVIHIGASSYFGSNSIWTRFGEADHDGPRNATDPAFIVDALAATPSDATVVSDDMVRGSPTTRYSVSVDLLEAASRAPDRVPRPHRKRPSWTLRADVWVDDEGLIRRATSATLPVSRPRRLARYPDALRWQTVEFWDFGLPVSILVPTVAPDDPSLISIVRDIWTQRRAYKREHPAS